MFNTKSAMMDAYDSVVRNEFSEGERARIENGYEKVLERTGLTTDQQDLYKRIGVEEGRPGAGNVLNILHDTTFAVNRLEWITNAQRQINAGQAVDFIRNRAMILAAVPEGETYSGAQFDAYRQLREIGIDVPTLIAETRKVKDGTNQESFEDIISQSDDAYYADYSPLKMQIETGVKNFVDFRIQNPGAANRPLWTQDPHWRLFTQFNGFLSTVTTTIVPKLWNEKFMGAVRTKNPALTYEVFGVIVVMMALGGLSQWVKDFLKYHLGDVISGEGYDRGLRSNPYLEDEDLVYRALLSSGVLGQFEKAAQIINPLYEQRGEGMFDRVVETATGPIGRQVENVYNAAFYASEGRQDAALRSFLKNVPIFSSFPGARNWATGRE